MKLGAISLALIMGGHGVGIAEGSANPYGVIAQRNVFHLNPPPAPAAPEKEPPAALPDVFLSGFVQSGGEWQVFMVIKVKNPDPIGPPLNSYLNLAEGDKKEVMSDQKQLVIKLVKVYADLEKVDILNCGTPMTLALKDNSFGNSKPDDGNPRVITAAERLASNDAIDVPGKKRRVRNVSGAPLKPKRQAPPVSQTSAAPADRQN